MSIYKGGIIMTENQERKGFTVYLDNDLKNEIEDYFLECRIKNFQEGYREIISIGFDQFKNNKKGGKK